MVFFRDRLLNGSTLVGDQIIGKPVSIGVAIPFGSGDESKSKKGVTHLLEHILFKAQSNEETLTAAKRIESSGGRVNAQTDTSSTFVYCTVPSKKLKEGILFLSESVKKPNATKKEFNLEKNVVIEEMGRDMDMPGMYVDDMAYRALYRAPFGLSVFGTKNSLPSLSLNDILDRWKSISSPENFVFSCVGDFDREEVKSLLNDRFGILTSNGSLMHPNPHKPKKRLKRYAKEHSELVENYMAYGVHAPDLRSNNMDAIDLIDIHLTSAASSFLFDEIREKRGLTYSIRGFVDQGKYHGNYTINVSFNDIDSLGLITRLIKKGFRDLQRLDGKGFRKIRDKAIGEIECDEFTTADLVEDLANYEIWGVGAEKYYRRKESLAAVTLDQVRALAKECGDNYALAVLAHQIPKDIRRRYDLKMSDN